MPSATAISYQEPEQGTCKRNVELASKRGEAMPADKARAPVANGAAPGIRVRPGPVSDSEAAERRQRVLEVASELFLARGYSGTSIDEIARRSRVSKATIYGECGTKEDIFREFYNSSLTPFMDDLRHAVERGQEIGAVVRQIVRGVLRTNADANSVGLLRLAIAERDRFPSIAELVLMHGGRAMKPFANYLRDQVGHDRMTDDEASRYTLHLFNMALGGSAVLLTDTESFYGDKEAWIDSVAEIFLSGFPMKRDGKSTGNQ